MPLVIQGGEGVRLGVVDRLLLRLDAATVGADQGPTVLEASIIDFKTDRPGDGSSADLDGFLDRHRDQMGTYAQAIGERYGLDPARIRVFLLRVDDGAVVEVPSL